MIKVFVGYDPRETVAYHVLSHSIISQCSEPVSISPLSLQQLRAIHRRSLPALASTEFSITRFLVPYLCDYKGWAIFMDCDMLLRDDLSRLWQLRDESYAVQVVKHNHIPRENRKFLNQKQVSYPMKNWSSVMMFNNAKCKALTPEYVDSAEGLDLHRFKWLSGLEEVGQLPHEWNHLVGYDRPADNIKNLHYTLGGPYFSDYADCDYADEWSQMHAAMNYAENCDES